MQITLQLVRGVVSSLLFTVSHQLFSLEYTVVNVQLKSDVFEWQRSQLLLNNFEWSCLMSTVLSDDKPSHQNQIACNCNFCFSKVLPSQQSSLYLQKHGTCLKWELN